MSYRTPLIPNEKSPSIMRHRLFVDSRDCVNTLQTFEFTVYLSDPFRDSSIGVQRFDRIQSVELKALAFPKVESQEYVIMDIAELNDERLYSSNPTANSSFAVMYFDTEVVGDIKPMKGFDYYQKDITFNPIIPSLSKLTVRFLKRDGSVISTLDTLGVDHCSFMLEITTLINQ